MSFESTTWRKFFLGVLPLLLAAALSMPGEARGASDLTEMDLESLMNVTIVGASRYEQKSSEAPSYASVVTADDIRKNGYRNLADLLRSLPGIFITNDRNYQYIGIRGFLVAGDYNVRVLVLVDGHRINNAVYDDAMIGNDFPVDIDLIERVEVVRGPSSSLYGSNAFFGIVNVITKRGGDIGGAELSGNAGSWKTFQGRATLGREFREGLELLVSGTAADSHGQDHFFPEFNDPATNNGVAEDIDGEKFHRLFAKAAWRGFTLEGVSSYRRKEIPTASFFTTFNDGRNRTVDESGYLDLRYEKDLRGGWNVLARTYLDYYHYWGDYTFLPDVNRDSGKSRTWGAELKAVRKIGERHRLTVGADFRYDFQEDQENFEITTLAVNLDSRQSSREWAVYVQDEFRIHPKLILNAGVRHDHYSFFGGTTNPRIGLIWLPRETTAVKLLYGKAFRVPTAYELHFPTIGLGTKPNPGLEPETIHSYEAVLEQRAEGLGGTWKATASAFRYRIDRLIAPRTDPSDGLLFFANSDPIDTNGVELEVANRMPRGFEGRASFAWQRSVIRGTGITPPNSPKRIAKVGLDLPLLPAKLLLSPEAQYISRRKTLPGKTIPSVPGYTVVNATLLAPDLPRGLELSASVYNIFDKSYADPAGPEHLQDSIPQDGRSYRVKATCRF